GGARRQPREGAGLLSSLRGRPIRARAGAAGENRIYFVGLESSRGSDRATGAGGGEEPFVGEPGGAESGLFDGQEDRAGAGAARPSDGGRTRRRRARHPLRQRARGAAAL